VDLVHGWAYALTVLGGAGELGALVWGTIAAARGQRRLRQRIADFTAAKQAQWADREANRRGELRFVPGDAEQDREVIEALWAERLPQVLGRNRSGWNDLELIPEHAAMAVLNDQVRAVAGPAALLVLSAFASTIGGLLSID
jgi:hypothetical protein